MKKIKIPDDLVLTTIFILQEAIGTQQETIARHTALGAKGHHYSKLFADSARTRKQVCTILSQWCQDTQRPRLATRLYSKLQAIISIFRS